MAKTKQQKEDFVGWLAERLPKATSVIFTNFDGLNVKATSELRKALRAQGIEYTVAKKSLMKVAFKKIGLESIDAKSIPGSVGMALGYADEVMPAKALSMFAKTNPTLKLVGGIYEGRLISAPAVKQLAALPSKEELLTKLVWLFSYPATGLVNVLANQLKSLLYALNAIKDVKSQI
ncbi:MAG: 50S ribosomal protein L10 [Patescibacteria group bacterium]